MMVRSSIWLAPGNARTIRALILLTLTIAACSPPAGPVQSPTAETPTAGLEPSPSLAATPVALSFGVESEAASTGTVTLEAGGTISATAADGTTFELVVPPEAVPADTEIRMTPLRDVGGLDASAVHAVLLEPAGLEFYDLARLTITPTQPITVADQLSIQAADDGFDPGPALVDPTTEAIVVLLEHFTVGLAASVTPQQRAIFLSKSAANAEERLARELAEAIQAEKRRQLVEGLEDLDALDEEERRIVDEYDREVVEKRRQAAMLSCAALEAYVRLVVGAERARVMLLGLDSVAATIAANERIVAALQAMITRYQECEKEAIAACKAAKNPTILVEFWLSMAKQFGQPVGDGAAMEKRAEQICDPKGYQFEFSGEWSGTDRNGAALNVTWHYWALQCLPGEPWKIWEEFDSVSGSAGTVRVHTGAPGADAQFGPFSVVFGADGAVLHGSWPGYPAGDAYLQGPGAQPRATISGTKFTLTPPAAPTQVNALIPADATSIPATAPVVPADGTIGSCEATTSP